MAGQTSKYQASTLFVSLWFAFLVSEVLDLLPLFRKINMPHLILPVFRISVSVWIPYKCTNKFNFLLFICLTSIWFLVQLEGPRNGQELLLPKTLSYFPSLGKLALQEWMEYTGLEHWRGFSKPPHNPLPATSRWETSVHQLWTLWTLTLFKFNLENKNAKTKHIHWGKNDLKVSAIIWKIVDKLTGKQSSMLLKSSGPCAPPMGARKGRSWSLWVRPWGTSHLLFFHTPHLVGTKPVAFVSFPFFMETCISIPDVFPEGISAWSENSQTVHTAALRQGDCWFQGESIGLGLRLSWSCPWLLTLFWVNAS